jgi:hypothetical protein
VTVDDIRELVERRLQERSGGQSQRGGPAGV